MKSISGKKKKEKFSLSRCEYTVICTLVTGFLKSIVECIITKHARVGNGFVCFVLVIVYKLERVSTLFGLQIVCVKYRMCSFCPVAHFYIVLRGFDHFLYFSSSSLLLT